MNSSLTYLFPGRLPTEKANGFQVSKMCEAFARNGWQVNLVHPVRKQPDSRLTSQTVFGYYGVEPCFKVTALSDWDIMPIESRLSPRLFGALQFVHDLGWCSYAVLKSSRRGHLYFTRDSSMALWLGMLSKPFVYECHRIPNGRVKREVLTRIAKFSSLRLAIGLTSHLKKGLLELGFPEEKTCVLADCVDLAVYQDLPEPAECRRRLGLPESVPLVGYVGRFEAMGIDKGVPDLIRAMGQLRSSAGKQARLVCVGGPLDRLSHYRQLAQSVGLDEKRVLFFDRVANSEVPYWIRALDVATIPSPWHEFLAYYTSPMKLFEYLGAGVPIVATDLPSNREVLTDGVNAVLVKPGDPASLSHGLDRVLSEPTLAKALREQARRTAQEFTWEKRAAIILERSQH